MVICDAGVILNFLLYTSNFLLFLLIATKMAVSSWVSLRRSLSFVAGTMPHLANQRN